MSEIGEWQQRRRPANPVAVTVVNLAQETKAQHELLHPEIMIAVFFWSYGRETKIAPFFHIGGKGASLIHESTLARGVRP